MEKINGGKAVLKVNLELRTTEMKKFIGSISTFIAAVAFTLAVLALPLYAAELPIEQRLIHAIGVIDGNSEKFTKRGLPRIKALEYILETDISAAQRDVAWETYRNMESNSVLRNKLNSAIESLSIISAEKSVLEDNLETTTAIATKQHKRAEAAEAEIHNAQIQVREARWQADHRVKIAGTKTVQAQRRAQAAEAKTKAIMGGAPVCSIERANVIADNSWTASGLRKKVNKLLECLSIGE